MLAFGVFQFGAPQERTHADDRWFGRDKLYHFAGSAIIQTATHTFVRAGGSEYRTASNLAAATTLAIGVGKELLDRADGRYFSWKDLVADVTGGTTAAVLVRQVDR